MRKTSTNSIQQIIQNTRSERPQATKLMVAYLNNLGTHRQHHNNEARVSLWASNYTALPRLSWQEDSTMNFLIICVLIAKAMIQSCFPFNKSRGSSSLIFFGPLRNNKNALGCEKTDTFCSVFCSVTGGGATFPHATSIYQIWEEDKFPILPSPQ